MTCSEIMGYVAFTPVLISEMSADLVYEMCDRSETNACWTYPLNAIVSLAAIALQPLCTAVAIVASAIFVLIGFATCSEKLLGEASDIFLGSAGLLVLTPVILTIRIFNPDFCAYYDRRSTNLPPQQLPLPQPNIPPPPPLVLPDFEYDPNFTPGPSSRPQGPMSQFFFRDNETANQT